MSYEEHMEDGRIIHWRVHPVTGKRDVFKVENKLTQLKPEHKHNWRHLASTNAVWCPECELSYHERGTTEENQKYKEVLNELEVLRHRDT